MAGPTIPDIPTYRPPEAAPPTENPFLEGIARVGYKASRHIQEGFGQTSTNDRKTDRQIVTEVDTKVEAELKEELGRISPQVKFFGEEGGGAVERAGDQWVVDPLDGTENMRGWPHEVAVSIGLLRNGEPIAGVIVDPLHKKAYVAEKGKGAYEITLNDDGTVKERKAIKVSDCPQIENTAMVGVDISSNEVSRTRALKQQKLILDAKAQSVKITGSPVAALAAVAEGSLDVYIREATKAPDLIAGVAIVREAGGKVLNYEGREWTVDDLGVGKGIIAGGEKIASELAVLLQKPEVAVKMDEKPIAEQIADEHAFDLDKLIPELQVAKAQGKTLVITNGHFVLLHPGHVESFQLAQEVPGGNPEDVALLVIVNNDKQTAAKDPEKAKLQAAQDRAAMVANQRQVSFVAISGSEDASVVADIQTLIDNGLVDGDTMYVKGGDYNMGDNIPPEAELIQKAGGRFLLQSRSGKWSTTELMHKLG